MSTHFGNSNSGENNVFQIVFPFRGDGIVVNFEVNSSQKVASVRIGRPYDRRVEISEIAEYGKLLVLIGEYVPKLEAELHANSD